MTGNKNLKEWLKKEIPNHYMFVNLKKDLIPNVLRPLRGSILFIPSRYEGFSLSLIEGMSCGLIPITYPVGVAPEIIKNGRNGFIVRSQTEAVRCVKKLVANNELREMMSQRACETALMFQSNLLAVKLSDFYRKVIREHRKGQNK